MVTRSRAQHAAAVAALQKDYAVLRVAYMIAKGFGRPEHLERLSDMAAVMKAMARGWVAEPFEEDFPYQLTDAGRVALGRWFRLVADHIDTNPECGAFWDAVTSHD